MRRPSVSTTLVVTLVIPAALCAVGCGGSKATASKDAATEQVGDTAAERAAAEVRGEAAVDGGLPEEHAALDFDPAVGPEVNLDTSTDLDADASPGIGPEVGPEVGKDVPLETGPEAKPEAVAEVATDSPCVPDCDGKECGDDGCGGGCGSCSEGQECDPQGVCAKSYGLVWKPIPGGTYMMGCSAGDMECFEDEKPAHLVALSPFWILETEVTEAQYLAVTGEDPSVDYGDPGGPDSPVTTVNWFDSKAFCKAVGGRLCTEAEWEYAARGGTSTEYYCGDDLSCLEGIAWYGTNSGGHKHDVKTKAPNAYGLYDMIGNVSELTADWYSHSYYSYSPANDPQGPSDGTLRVLRGGFFFNGGPYWLRVSTRRVLLPWDLDWTTGLRCCRSE
jgi:formylglycine-generating enzyme required for sulfatase activity